MDIMNFCDKMMMLTVRTKNPKILFSKKEGYMSLYREDREIESGPLWVGA